MGTPLREWDTGLVSADPLDFPSYVPPLDRESVRTGLIRIGGVPCAIVESQFDVFGGSMGVVAGEKVARAYHRAIDARLPLLAVVRTGGARMQEGMLSLVQMGRTAAAASAHSRAGLLSVASFRSPTTGGVYASYASLTDLRIAESGATIGFGGPRVVEHVTGAAPPPGSNTAESALAAGLVDHVEDAEKHESWVAVALGAAERGLLLPPGRPPASAESRNRSVPGRAYRTVLRARARRRPSGLEWAAALCSSWLDLGGADRTVRAGLAVVDGVRAVVVAMDRHSEGAVGRQGPEAFRLAQRAIRMADRLGLPVLTLVDTPGAEPGPEAEAGGVAGEIARTLRDLADLSTSSVSLVVGEGGSGGAVALAYTDRLYMLEGAVFSVIAPEAASVILWRTPDRAAEAARSLRVTAPELERLRLVDGVLGEYGASAVGSVRATLGAALRQAVPGDRSRRLDEAMLPALVEDLAGRGQTNLRARSGTR
ncbi:carboxyl transferase domain-containing protein [Nocardiopsis oceani]